MNTNRFCEESLYQMDLVVKKVLIYICQCQQMYANVNIQVHRFIAGIDAKNPSSSIFMNKTR